MARILIVDNERLLAENLKEFLHQRGDHRVNVVTTASEAFSCLSVQQFDIVVADVHLAHGEKNDWLNMIATVKPGQRVIVISAYSLPEQIQQNQGLNIIGYLEKPFDMNTLAQMIDECNADTNDVAITFHD